MSKDQTSIWNYIFNEMPEDIRLSFEKEMGESSKLQTDIATRKKMDRWLKNALPDTQLSLDELKEQAYQEWMKHLHGTTISKQKDKVIHFPSRVLIAVAALCMIAFGLHFYEPSNIQWQQPTFTVSQVRGMQSTRQQIDDHRKQQILTDIMPALETTVHHQYHALAQADYLFPVLSTDQTWRLSTEILERRRGVLQLHIQAIDTRTDTSMKSWRITYLSLDKLERNIPRLGSQIARDLWALEQQ